MRSSAFPTIGPPVHAVAMTPSLHQRFFPLVARGGRKVHRRGPDPARKPVTVEPRRAASALTGVGRLPIGCSGSLAPEAVGDTGGVHRDPHCSFLFPGAGSQAVRSPEALSAPRHTARRGDALAM